MKYLGLSQHIRLAMAARDAGQAMRTENLSRNVTDDRVRPRWRAN